MTSAEGVLEIDDLNQLNVIATNVQYSSERVGSVWRTKFHLKACGDKRFCDWRQYAKGFNACRKIQVHSRAHVSMYRKGRSAYYRAFDTAVREDL